MEQEFEFDNDNNLIVNTTDNLKDYMNELLRIDKFYYGEVNKLFVSNHFNRVNEDVVFENMLSLYQQSLKDVFDNCDSEKIENVEVDFIKNALEQNEKSLNRFSIFINDELIS